VAAGERILSGRNREIKRFAVALRRAGAEVFKCMFDAGFFD